MRLLFFISKYAADRIDRVFDGNINTLLHIGF